MKLKLLFAAACAVLAACAARPPPTADEAALAELMSWKDVLGIPPPEDVPHLHYASGPQQFGELRLPPGIEGRFPVVILIHGDCWGEEDSYAYLRPLAQSLATLGVASWTIEYRRIGSGGGWPQTFLDVADATDYLRDLARSYPLDLTRVVAVGHSGGGQLALWLASRSRLPEDSPLYRPQPLPIHGVIGLAAMTELEAQRATTIRDCGANVDRLLDGGPQSVPERYAQTSPIQLLPLGVPQWFVHGARDPVVPAERLMRYAEAARKKGDPLTLGVTTEAGHWEPVVPGSPTWMTLQQAIIAALLE